MKTPRAARNGRARRAQFATRPVSVPNEEARAGERVGQWTARADGAGAGRGRRGVRELTAAVPPRAAGALLPHARLAPGRRGRPAGHVARGLAGPRRLRGPGRRCAPGSTGSPPTAASTRAARPAAARRGVERARCRAARADPARRGGLARAVSRRCWTARRRRRSARRPATSAARRSRWPSSPRCRSCRRARSRCCSCATCSGSGPPRWRRCSTRRSESVTSALKRARAGLRRRWTPTTPPPAAPGFAAPRTRSSTRFVRAWESADVDALVSLLTDDVRISMPPMPVRVRGPRAGGPVLRQPLRRRPEVRPGRDRANGQPAFGAYLRGDDGVSPARASTS